MKVYIVSWWDEVDKVFDSLEKAEEYVTKNDNPNRLMTITEHEVT